MTPLVYGHRGASASAPENTLEAFRLAAEHGADGVELDVRRSSDGALVLHHDAALPDGRLVCETLRDELPAGVPTLEEALDECRGLVVNIEIKNISYEPDFDPDCTAAEQVVELLAARCLADSVLVSSFHLRTIDRVKAREPSVATGLITFLDPLPMEGAVRAAERGHHAVHPHHVTVDAALVARAHDAGLQVNAWTVDDADRIVELVALGIDGVITNVPATARQVLGPPARR